MKKTMLCFAGFIAISFCAVAQTDMQISIQTDEGIITVSKTADGRDMIILSMHRWDEMAAGTSYSSGNLHGLTGRRLCIEIADKKHGLCKAGIGFGCGMYDCPPGIGHFPALVNNDHRICSVTVIKIYSSVELIFNDKVDWQSLQDSKPLIATK